MLATELLRPSSEYYLDSAIRDYLKLGQIAEFSQHYTAIGVCFI